jgi:fructosamine-3-kinase
MVSTSRSDCLAPELAAALAEATGLHVADRPGPAVGGGSINECVQWPTSDGLLFVKLADAGRFEMFAAEAEGLHELQRAAALRVPRVLGLGAGAGRAFLALEWIAFGRATPQGEALLGEQLAALHRVTAARFGWHRDNTIGATPQSNAWLSEWPAFYAQRRLGFQLDLAAAGGHGGGWLDRGRQLCERSSGFFAAYHPQPSLLHGDLWGGNWAVDRGGAPVLYDPAVYYGDREADLAMTQLFGGFGARFYDAYQAAWPLAPGAGQRRDLYNLYHVLNHLNLFGGGYRGQAQAMIERLLAELG